MYDNFLQGKYGKEINFHIDFYKGLWHKNKHVRRTSDCELQQDCFFEFPLCLKKNKHKKVPNPAFDRNKPVDFFYCQFNY